MPCLPDTCRNYNDSHLFILDFMDNTVSLPRGADAPEAGKFSGKLLALFIGLNTVRRSRLRAVVGR